MKTITLNSSIRQAVASGLQPLRRENKIPAVLYGHGQKNLNLVLAGKEFSSVYDQAGYSTLIDLVVDKKPPVKVLIKDIQYHPATDQVLHVDFYKVDMNEKIEAEVELEFTGISPAVKEEGGVLVKDFDTIEVRCLPGDLPSRITVDISSLATFDDAIKIKDLDISDKVEIIPELDQVIATVTPPRSDEELAQLDEAVEEDVEAVEGVKKEEPKEGEEAAEADEAGKEAAGEADKKEAPTEKAPEKKE